MSVRFRLALLAAIALLAPSPGSAQEWTSDVRRKFVDRCLLTCNENTTLSRVQRIECPPYCECMIKGAQEAMTADDYLASAQVDPATKPLRDQLDKLATACRQKVFR
jgi:hypothetical protein